MLPSFDHLRPDEYWKFFTDVKQWEKNDPEVFDKDQSPGYFRHCSIALLWMLKTLNRQVDLDYIIALRNVAYHADPKVSDGLALNVSSGLGTDSFSRAGLEQLIQENKSNESVLYLQQDIGFLGEHFKRFEGMTSWDVENLMTSLENGLEHSVYRRLGLQRTSANIDEVVNMANSLLERYQQEIKKAESENEKLAAIIRLIQALHQFHLFPDGNGRTFCFFLLNRLLLDQNLAPTIVNNPGNFTGWSLEELMLEVTKGQERFRSLCSPLEVPLVATIERKIQLTSEEKNRLFVSEAQRDQKEQLFYQAIKNKNKQQQIDILKKLPQYERVLLLKKQCRQVDVKQVSEDLLERLRFFCSTAVLIMMIHY